MPSRSIHVVTNGRISFFFMAELHTHTHTHTHTRRGKMIKKRTYRLLFSDAIPIGMDSTVLENK